MPYLYYCSVYGRSFTNAFTCKLACPKACGEPCVPCLEKCTWLCQHFRCSRRCSSPCNRPPCNAPCPRQLRCRHPCVGLCGERCPKLCRLCHTAALTETFFGTEDEPNARFICLEECGHVFEVTAFDRYMGLTPDGNDANADAESEQIQLKTCPKCKQPIRRSGRYKRLVNSTLRDIEVVKQRVRGELHPGDLLERLQRFEAQFATSNLKEKQRRFVDQLVQEYESGQRQLSADAVAYMKSLLSFFEVLSRVHEKLDSACPATALSGSSSTEYLDQRLRFVRNLRALENWLFLYRLRFTNGQCSQFDAEIQRAQPWIALLEALSRINQTSGLSVFNRNFYSTSLFTRAIIANSYCQYVFQSP